MDNFFSADKLSRNFNIPQATATVAASYMKRILEKKYDEAFKLEFLQWLKSQPVKTKYAIEFALYTLTSVFDQKFSENSPIKKFIKEILMDSGSEISKRLINGDSEQVISFIETPKNKESLLSMLLMLEEDQMEKFTEWLIASKGFDKQAALRALKSTSADDFKKIAKMSDEKKTSLMKAIAGEPKEPSDFFKGALLPLQKRMRSYVDNKKGGDQNEGQKS